MNLTDLEKHIRTVTAFEWCGQTVHFRKLTAEDHIALFGKLQSADTADGHAATAAFHVEVVARSWADESGELVANSDEGREKLRLVGFNDLVALGKLALKFNGYDEVDEKKSTAGPTCSPSDCAETLDPRTSTPTTSCPA